jgi:hypothetical protein
VQQALRQEFTGVNRGRFVGFFSDEMLRRLLHPDQDD